MPDRLRRVKEVAKMLDVSSTHLYRLIESGQIESHSVGERAIRISDEALRAFLRGRRRTRTSHDESQGQVETDAGGDPS